MRDLKIVEGSATQTVALGRPRTVNLIPQPQGGVLRQGGAPGETLGTTHIGKPTNEFRAWCLAAATSDAVRLRIERELTAGDGPFPVALWERLLDRAFGKVAQATTNDTALKITVTHE